MTNDDKVSALSLAYESPYLVVNEDNGKRQNAGGLGYSKKGGKGPYGAEVGQLLYSRNGTYRWDINDPRDGLESFDNIYQAMAADIYVPGARQKLRIQTGDEREADVRSGIKTLALWLDEVWGTTLYRCTSPDRLRNQVVIVTVLPDLIVDEATGMTAFEQQRVRDMKAIDGQLTAAMRRQARLEGDIARETLKLRVDQLIDGLDIPKPRGYRSKPLLISD